MTKTSPLRLSYRQVMAELKAAGTEQNDKIYRNHGVTGKKYGVSYAFLKNLTKGIGIDHDLALQLWDSEIHDARVLACWTADKDCMTAKQLGAWARAVDNHVIACEVVGLAQDMDQAATFMTKWLGMKGEWRPVLGWGVLSRLVMQVKRGPDEGGVDDQIIGEWLKQLEENIQNAANRTRHSMNGALISIGSRKGWRTKALAAAKRIGKIEVEYGDTSCSVNDATASIKKVVEHYAKKGKLPTDGAAGLRRRHC
ncbi:MAG: 3-methyladenine DNA glycosylase AlkD [Planctomycetota bacterium]|jgi:3-methyladenine DNA glycosylase AlkD